MIKRIYFTILSLLCLGMFSCSDDKTQIDPSAAEPVVTFAFDNYTADLNKVDNLPVVAVIKSEAGIKQIQMQILKSDQTRIDHKTVTEFFDLHSYSMAEKINFKSDYSSFIVTVTDLLGRTNTSELKFSIIEVKEPPTVVFTPDKIVFNEMTDDIENMPKTHFEASSIAGLKSIEMWRVSNKGQVPYGNKIEFNSGEKTFTLDDKIVYGDGDLGFKVKVTDIYDQVKIQSLSVLYLSVPAPVVTFLDTEPLVVDAGAKNVSVKIHAEGSVKKVQLFRVEGSSETKVSDNTYPSREKDKTVTASVSFTLATTALRAEVTDFAGKVTKVTVKAIVGMTYVPEIQIGSHTFTAGNADYPDVYALLSFKDMKTYPLSDALTNPTNVDFTFFANSGGGKISLRFYAMDGEKGSMYKDGDQSIANLTTKNKTRMAKLPADFDFENATAETINAIVASTLTLNKVADLAPDDVVAFVTASTSTAGGDRIGVIKLISEQQAPGKNTMSRVAKLSIKFPKP